VLGKVLSVILALSLARCGTDVQGQDPVISAVVVSPQEMPFHGPGGPGTSPISITFSWTMILAVSGGRQAKVGLVQTQVRERQSGEILTIETGPEKHGGLLRANGVLEVPQRVGGFFDSSLFPGSWAGFTTVEVTYPSRRTDKLVTEHPSPATEEHLKAGHFG
jgi:hypothetical protein